MNILAIDPGRNNIGYCSYFAGQYTVSNAQPNNLWACFTSVASVLLNAGKFDFVAIEEAAYMAHGSAKLGEVYGVVKAAVESFEIKYVMVNIQSWKSITGFRHKKTTSTDKKEYLYEAQRIAPVVLETIDEADAYFILRAVRDALEGPDVKECAGLRERMKKAGILC